MREYPSLDAFLQDLPALAEGAEEALRGHSGLFCLEIRQGPRIWLRLRDGRLSVEKTGAAPDCTVTAGEQTLLDIIHPLEGEVIAHAVSPADGRVFFAHHAPLVKERGVVYKIIT